MMIQNDELDDSCDEMMKNKGRSLLAISMQSVRPQDPACIRTFLNVHISHACVCIYYIIVFYFNSSQKKIC